MSTKRLSGLLAALFALAFGFAASAADDAPSPYDVPVRVCPDRGEASPPSFDRPECEEGKRIFQVDPQGRSLWVEARLDIAASDAPADAPMGIYLAAKASSEMWLNGVRLGLNGRPSRRAADERIGKMDAVFYAPRDLIRDGENEIAIKMSSHHGLLRLAYPTHSLGAAPYQRPDKVILSAYAPSILTFGAFLAGAFYFGAAAARAEERLPPALLATASTFAGLQLLAEVARGAFSYPYTMHDVRLLAIVVFSCGVGLALCAYVIVRARPQHAPALFVASLAAAGAAALAAPGFDSKAMLGFLATAVAAFGVAAWRTIRPDEQGRRWAAAPWVALSFAGLIAVALLRPTKFLDANFFFAFAGLLLLLFVLEARALADERAARLTEAARAARLEEALADADRGDAPQRLTLKDGGASVFASPEEIIACSGAGDYVDVRMTGARNILHAGTLGELERSLPSSFLRVHRSHLVNANFVRGLRRASSGAGSLDVAEGDPLPVSRRIMPKVRASLAET
ncbi:MAG: LytTR family DNA-binding domain-containing protein [Pseudomonadota bacterium]